MSLKNETANMTDETREIVNASIGALLALVVVAVILYFAKPKEPTQVINWDGTPYTGDAK